MSLLNREDSERNVEIQYSNFEFQKPKTKNSHQIMRLGKDGR